MADLTTDQLADRLRVSPRTVEAWRRSGKGPAYHREGRMVLYHPRDVEVWLDTCSRGSTLEQDEEHAAEEQTLAGLLQAILEELQGLRSDLRGR